MAVAQGMAVLTEPVSPTLLGRLCGISASSATGAIDCLRRIRFLDPNGYRHEAVRTAVFEGVASEARGGLHARAAQLLHKEGAAPTTVAWHLIVGEPVEAVWVVPILQEAAEQALLDEDLELAIRFLRAAYDRCHDDRRQTMITSALAKAEWQIDPGAVRRRLPELISAVQEGVLTGRDGMAVVGYALWHGRIADLVAILEGCASTRRPSGPFAR